MLPEESGIQVCQKIREHDQEVVISTITARDAEEDKLLGFKAGADDYVTKPFGMKELSARIKANFRRSLASSASPRGKVLEYGNLWLDTKNFTARLEGEPLNLRLMEFKILAALASQPGTLKSREELAKEVWADAGVGSSRTIDVHIRRLRVALAEKSKSEHEYVHTVRGLGYRFEVHSEGSA